MGLNMMNAFLLGLSSEGRKEKVNETNIREGTAYQLQ